MDFKDRIQIGSLYVALYRAFINGFYATVRYNDSFQINPSNLAVLMSHTLTLSLSNHYRYSPDVVLLHAGRHHAALPSPHQVS